jgi:hypothetical protein
MPPKSPGLVTKLGIPELANRPMLKAVWKTSLRPRLKTTRFKDFELARDPLEWLGLERGLDAMIEEVCQQLLAGTYRPRSPEWIRSAKRVGLTRRLAFLSVRDQLVYRALVALAENELLAASAPWTRLGRADKGDDESISTASGWFRDWLKRDGQIWVMNSAHEWIVESDISNFFPSVHVDDICSFVQANSRLTIGLVRLLEFMLDTFSPMAGYQPSRVGGLPQEGFNVSRVLAHAFLGSLDDEFASEGSNDRYSRWVDDVVIGTDTWDESLRAVDRMQMALEAIGLYPNGAKTRIIRSSAFRADYMKDENDWIGDVEAAIRDGTGVNIAEFEDRLKHHLTRPDRPKAWGRVLRRYYTNARTLRSQLLVPRWPEHVDTDPDSARHIFDYLSTFRLTIGRFQRLLEVLDRFGSVYEDVEILAHEYVCVAPCRASPGLTDSIGDWALGIVQREAGSRPRIAAVAAMTVGKFGNIDHLNTLHGVFRAQRVDNVFRTQAAVVLAAVGRVSAEDLRALIGRSQAETLETLEFLLALMQGEKLAVGMTIAALGPVAAPCDSCSSTMGANCTSMAPEAHLELGWPPGLCGRTLGIRILTWSFKFARCPPDRTRRRSCPGADVEP